MSFPSTGATRAGRWGYVASVMVAAMERAEQRGSFDASDLPEAVRYAVRDFFALVRDALNGKTPGDPQASVTNYRIAADAARASANVTIESRAQLERQLVDIAVAVDQLLSDGGESSSVPFADVRKFFASVVAAGDEEAYSSAVADLP
jgi:hypothetical protein